MTGQKLAREKAKQNLTQPMVLTAIRAKVTELGQTVTNDQVKAVLEACLWAQETLESYRPPIPR